MFQGYDKRDLNLIECILFNTILGIIFWIATGFISSIQDKILKLFRYNYNSLAGLDILLYMCPLLLLYWFSEIISHKVKYNLPSRYSKIIPLITIIVTIIVLNYFWGFLKFTF